MNLPALVLELGGGVIEIDTDYIRPSFASVYAIIDDGQVALFDTGHGFAQPLITAALAARGLSAQAVRLIIISHPHLDHCGGAGHCARAFPAAQLIAHQRAVPLLIEPSKLISGARLIYGDRFDTLYGEVLPIAADRIKALGEGATLSLGSRQLQILDTPGHTFHHIAVVDRKADCCLAGDAFGLRTPATLTKIEVMRLASAPTQFDPESWRTTIRRLAGLAVSRILITHSGVVDGDLGARARELEAELDAFVGFAHEAQHEAQPNDAIRALIAARWARLLKLPELSGEAWSTDIALSAAGIELWMRKHMDQA